ncbi:hypothetical protein MKK88_13830 [Methylobacterium sp. E-005]|uniref:hypothetical protein n=1 Tax=Methylobacterium sp. E-005 TaxID=2836549 RepID=UPI001FBBF759|nr:hypothetical protein [Methylobacterium sp. E-005]MCJ2087056.1 hypothetical protein [Methylobacterium sp. E-005]
MVDKHMDGDSEDKIDLTTEDEDEQLNLDRFAGQALVLWDLLEDLDPASAARLRPKLQILLAEVGRIIASEMAMVSVDLDSDGDDLH